MQDKIRSHIDRNIGSRAPILEDKYNIPYLEAAILETLRIMSNVPLLLPHKTTRDVEFEGYHIPQNTQVSVVIEVIESKNSHFVFIHKITQLYS